MPNTAILNIRNVKNSAGGPSGYLYNLLKVLTNLTEWRFLTLYI